jgi:hypothetical protein
MLPNKPRSERKEGDPKFVATVVLTVEHLRTYGNNDIIVYISLDITLVHTYIKKSQNNLLERLR